MTRPLVLGIESSCDDTSLALYAPDQNRVLACTSYNQNSAHQYFGGVVPEIASREHLSHLPRLFELVLEQSGAKASDITAIGVTCRPGLIGSLLIGVSYARALSYALDVPLYGIDHLEGHIFSIFIERAPVYPFLSLLISGGHSHLYLVEAFGRYQILARTLDDALGEAFDKIAKMLGLTYPGGAELEKLAELSGGELAFPTPLQGQKTLDFSFSGLKTFALYSIQAQNLSTAPSLLDFERWQKTKTADEIAFAANLALGFQKRISLFLGDRIEKAIRQTGVRRLGICGGVAQNRFLQQAFTKLAEKHGAELYQPIKTYMADNGAMIAYLAALYQTAGPPDHFVPESLSPLGRKKLQAPLVAG